MAKSNQGRKRQPIPSSGLILTPEELQRMPELLAWVKDLEEETRQRQKNHRVLSANYKKWLARYPEQYVVVIDGRLAGIGKDRKKLYQRLARRGFDTKTAVSAHLTTKPRPKFVLLKVA